MPTEIFSFLTVVLLFAFDIGVRVVALGVIPNNRKPSEATAWLLAVFFIPVVGIFFYLLLGNSKLSKKRRTKQRAINELIYNNTLQQYAIAQENTPPEWFLSIAQLNSHLGAMPLVGGNGAKLIQDYTDSLQEMAKSIDAAKHYVHVEFYIMSLDKTTKQFFTSLKNARKRGVIVRVLFDHVGSLQYPDYKKLSNSCKRITSPTNLCCQLSHCRVNFSGQTCAIIANLWLSMAALAIWVRKILSIARITKKRTLKKAYIGMNLWYV